MQGVANLGELMTSSSTAAIVEAVCYLARVLSAEAKVSAGASLRGVGQAHGHGLTDGSPGLWGQGSGAYRSAYQPVLQFVAEQEAQVFSSACHLIPPDLAATAGTSQVPDLAELRDEASRCEEVRCVALARCTPA